MKKIHTLGLTLFAVFAFSAVVASSAFALESVFLIGGVKPTAEFTTDSTLVAGTTMLLEDTSTIIGKVDIVCSNVTSTGAIADGGNAKLDLVNTVTFVTCKSETAGCTLLSIAALDLPWLTELTLSGTIFLDNVREEGKGFPGYLIECEIGGITIDDTCTTNTKSTDLDNTTENDIIALFLATETASCTQGNATSGKVVGEVLTLTVSGAALAVSEG